MDSTILQLFLFHQ